MNTKSGNNVNGSWSAKGALDSHDAQHDSEDAATLRHDLADCLQEVLLKLDLMQRKQELEEKHAIFLEDCVSRMSLLVQHWRILSNTRQQQQNYQLFNLAHALLKMLEANMPFTTLKNQSVEINLGYTEAVMLGDQHQIQQALDNVILNAVKYAPEGGVVSVSMATEHDMAIITIRDNGIGIPDEDQLHVFEEDYYTQNMRSGHFSGVCLGLTRVKKVIEQHGGTILLRSVYGEGTQIKICLPLHIERHIFTQ